MKPGVPTPLGAITSPSPGKVTRVKRVKSAKPDSPPMTASPQELAARTIQQRPEGRTLRLKPTVRMTLPGGQLVPNKDQFTKDPVHGFNWGTHPHIDSTQLLALQTIVISHANAFASTAADLPGYTGPVGNFEIQLTTDESIFTWPRRKSPLELEISNEKSQELVDLGFLVRAPTPAKYASEVTCPSKKNAEGEWVDRRQCGDFRALNSFTVSDRASMPLPDDIFAKAGNSSFFSKLDLRSGFHQIHIKPSDQPKTAIWWKDELWMHTRMPFGLKNAPAHFQRVVTEAVMAGGAHSFCRVYIDDLVIFSDTFEEHLNHVNQILTILHSVGLKVHPGKSIFGCDGLEYLGHYISKDGLSPMEAKTLAFRQMRVPTSKDEIKVAMGLFNYYRGFVPGFSTIAQPITNLLRSDIPWQWGPEQDSAFQELVEALCTPGVILRPVDYSRPLRIHTDWSGRGIGALLTQLDDTKLEYVCAAASRSLNRHESAYSSYHGEMLACVWAVKIFHHYVHGVSFTVVTDHQPLTYLLTASTLTGKLARWALLLAEYDIKIEHRPGVMHQNADALSRLISPAHSSDDHTGVRLDGPAVTPLDDSLSAASATLMSPSSPSPPFQMSQTDPGSCTGHLPPDGLHQRCAIRAPFVACPGSMDSTPPLTTQMLGPPRGIQTTWNPRSMETCSVNTMTWSPIRGSTSCSRWTTSGPSMTPPSLTLRTGSCIGNTCTTTTRLEPSQSCSTTICCSTSCWRKLPGSGTAMPSSVNGTSLQCGPLTALCNAHCRSPPPGCSTSQCSTTYTSESAPARTAPPPTPGWSTPSYGTGAISSGWPSTGCQIAPAQPTSTSKPVRSVCTNGVMTSNTTSSAAAGKHEPCPPGQRGQVLPGSSPRPPPVTHTGLGATPASGGPTAACPRFREGAPSSPSKWKLPTQPACPSRQNNPQQEAAYPCMRVQGHPWQESDGAATLPLNKAPEQGMLAPLGPCSTPPPAQQPHVSLQHPSTLPQQHFQAPHVPQQPMLPPLLPPLPLLPLLPPLPPLQPQHQPGSAWPTKPGLDDRPAKAFHWPHPAIQPGPARPPGPATSPAPAWCPIRQDTLHPAALACAAQPGPQPPQNQEQLAAVPGAPGKPVQSLSCCALHDLNVADDAPLPGRYDGDSDVYGVKPTQGLATAVLSPTFFQVAQTEGITLFEPFGGMASGLEMLLQQNVRVLRYLYSDTDPVARHVAVHRCKTLSIRYPTLFPACAWDEMFTLPQDVTQIQSVDLLRAGVLDGTQWMVVAGWECQDLSPAGNCEGLTGLHSSTYFDLLRVVGTLQQLLVHQPLAYLLENVSLQHNHSSRYIREVTYPFVCSALGVPLVFDACQVGSYAHRLRAYWTNLGSVPAMQVIILGIQRRPSQVVAEILEPNHKPQPITRSDQLPYYQANVLDPANPRPRAAFPTLMAHPSSYAFRDGGPGTLLDIRTGRRCQPSAEERERCMGYATGSTAATGLSDRQRCGVLGRAMDGFALRAIYSAASHLAASSTSDAVTSLSELGGGGKGDLALTAQSDESLQNLTPQQYTFAQLIHADAAEYLHEVALSSQAEAQETPKGLLADVFEDQATMAYLRNATMPSSAQPLELRRVLKRAQSYSFHSNGFMYRLMPDGSSRRVPHPSERLGIVADSHRKCGHFGQKRTRSLLLSSFWWVGMSRDIERVLKSCQACARANATFNKPHPTLHPVPVIGPFYRWNVDLCGPLPTSEAGYKYVMVCIESLTKHVEAIPLKTKEATEVAAAFLTHVLGRFGGCAEVLSDQGTEFQGTFHALLTSCLIDHRLTSPNHPQANGLSERCVQTVKRALRKLTDDVGHVKTWHKQLPWLVLGYLCSAQRATGFSPYELLYATHPVVPPAIRERMIDPIDFDDVEAAAASLLTRSALVKRNMPLAMGNIQIAQHRDTLRYAMVKGGAFIPKLRRFEVGDFVYIRRRHTTDTLQFSSHPEVLQVAEVLPQGTLRLRGMCGQEITMHCSNCTPCHLLNINRTLDPALARPNLSHKCEICRSAEGANDMLLCSTCNSGWHLHCFQPPLLVLPKGDWFCPICVTAGRASHPSPTQNNLTLLPALSAENIGSRPPPVTPLTLPDPQTQPPRRSSRPSVPSRRAQESH